MSFYPHTPLSPSQPSPSTPEIPTSMASTTMTTPVITTTNALPTPAHSINGSSSSQAHERLPNDPATTATATDEEAQLKRKRAVDDLGDRDRANKKVHVEANGLSIEDLHLDVGAKYLLCRTPHPEAVPMVSEDLFEMFDLGGLAAEVARVTSSGEKNALRKTYKGHIKRLGILGHFDAVRKEENDPNGLMAMVSLPEHDWNVHNVYNRDIRDGLSKETMGRLEKAMTMAKGPVDAVWDTSVLGELAWDPSGRHSVSARPTAPSTPAGSATPAFNARVKMQGGDSPAGQVQKPAVGVQDQARSKRNPKKRGHGDSGFEGYGDGFPDDDGGPETGYPAGEGDDRGGQKRRKKASGSCSSAANLANTLQNSSSQAFAGPMRQASYGPSTVGA